MTHTIAVVNVELREWSSVRSRDEQLFQMLQRLLQTGESRHDLHFDWRRIQKTDGPLVRRSFGNESLAAERISRYFETRRFDLQQWAIPCLGVNLC